MCETHKLPAPQGPTRKQGRSLLHSKLPHGGSPLSPVRTGCRELLSQPRDLEMGGCLTMQSGRQSPHHPRSCRDSTPQPCYTPALPSPGPSPPLQPTGLFLAVPGHSPPCPDTHPRAYLGAFTLMVPSARTLFPQIPQGPPLTSLRSLLQCHPLSEAFPDTLSTPSVPLARQ